MINKFGIKEFIIIISIVLLHSIINNFEKLLVQDKFGSIRRPTNDCATSDSLKCLGMPSGHTECATIAASILLGYNIIPKYIYILLILLIALQRVIWSRHSFNQVFAGFIMGLIYSVIYLIYFKQYCSYFCSSVLVIPLLIIIIYLTIFVISVDNEVISTPVPSWVDPKLYPIIIKKQNVSYLNKVYNLTYTLGIDATTSDKVAYFCSWNKLENILDNLIVKLNGMNKSFDIIIGIKSGGAIVSNYLANKMNLPNYYIKVQQSKYNCNKGEVNEISSIIDKHIKGNKQDYMVCEGINEDITGKKILLVDELIASGTTIFETEKYLISNKNILPENITIAAISIISKKSVSYINSHQYNEIINKAILP